MNANTGHGHVYPRPDGVRARCGGPEMCGECSIDFVRELARVIKLLDNPVATVSVEAIINDLTERLSSGKLVYGRNDASQPPASAETVVPYPYECTCGEPGIPGVVHRRYNLPCYHQDPAPSLTPEQVAELFNIAKAALQYPGSTQRENLLARLEAVRPLLGPKP